MQSSTPTPTPTPSKTPTQQAIIQFVESIILLALIAGLYDVATAVPTNGNINWAQLGITFALAVLGSLAHSVSAYLKALPAQNSQQNSAAPLDLTALAPALNAVLSPFVARLDALLAAQTAQQGQGQQRQAAPPATPAATSAAAPALVHPQQIPAISKSALIDIPPVQTAAIDWSAATPDTTSPVVPAVPVQAQ